jgi:hypothetical protein
MKAHPGILMNPGDEMSLSLVYLYSFFILKRQIPGVRIGRYAHNRITPDGA